jgi:hypothetical protein
MGSCIHFCWENWSTFMLNVLEKLIICFIFLVSTLLEDKSPQCGDYCKKVNTPIAVFELSKNNGG